MSLNPPPPPISPPSPTLVAQGRERCSLAKLAILVVLQVGLDFPEMQKSLHPVGTMLAQDNTVLAAERAEVCACIVCYVS